MSFQENLKSEHTDAECPQMVCAFSLSNTALRTAPLPKSKRNKFNKIIPNAKRRSQYPAILIGQLCVFDGFGHQHVGDEMMDLIKTIAINPENTSAARYLVVDAVNKPNVISFYEKNGFKFLFASGQEEQECLHNTEHNIHSIVLTDRFHERIANHDFRHCDELSDYKAIYLVASTLESIMSADTSTGQDEKRNLEAQQRRMSIYS